MVPAPASRAPAADHLRGAARVRRPSPLLRLGRRALGLLLLALLIPASRASGSDDGPIEWKRAFIVGESSRESSGLASTDALTLAATDLALLHVVVEGERDGLPVFCLDGPRFKMRGRAIPNRLLLTPAEAGLQDAEVHWTELRPSRDAKTWVRRRVAEGEARWTLEMTTFPADPRTPDEPSEWGTGRFAAAVSLPGAEPHVVLASSGWGHEFASPDGGAPGYRVSRAADPTLAGWALALARLPVLPDATDQQVRERVALRPVDVVLAAYEEMADSPLPPSTSTDLAAPEWSWLFETRQSGVARRKPPEAAVVGSDARGVRWGAEGVRAGDVLLSGGAFAVLERDDGDGWLGEADGIVAAVSGEVRRGVLHDLPGRELTVLRPREFGTIRNDLARAGYGNLGLSPLFGADLHRALSDFQHDRDFPVTGVPDERTRAAIAEFLGRLRSAGPGGEATSP